MIHIGYNPKLKELLCPKCNGKADWNNNGDLQCSEPDCKYIYYTFSDKDNSFQMGLFKNIS